jgi:ATP-dependent Lhr-like helicase
VAGREKSRTGRGAAAATAPAPGTDPLALFHPPTRQWFERSFPAATQAQRLAWPALAAGDSTLLLAPTGSGKTLAAFLHAIDRLMFGPMPAQETCRILYVSPLKALAVDVERNLRAPIAGITHLAAATGSAYHIPAVAVRTGDTPARERAQFSRAAADILITTPESLYLLLTSNARDRLRGLETVIIDEIHALVPTKRGAHLALSLERLEALVGRRLQRIGLSATQRPLDEVARFLGGIESDVAGIAESSRATPAVPGSLTSPEALVSAELARTVDVRPHRHRPVTIVDAGHSKTLELVIEVPVEDMAQLGKAVDVPTGPAAQGPVRASIWTAIHPRLLELVRAHRSTLIFVNARRIAERLAQAINELAGEVLAYAHHGSVAPAQRAQIEDRLKTGDVKALVATSSLELGIDMGAIDLVVQIEAPPSVASGLQRIGRAGHQVDAPSRGVVFPKYRGDLLACAAVARAMRDGDIEPVRYPRNPLDVLAQQMVAMVAMDACTADALFAAVRQAAPFAALSRVVFDTVLDMLTGHQISDDFADLRARLNWDRVSGQLEARASARRIAVISAGTIPDRGLFGVFLAGGGSGGRGAARVGELDEEMVFESRVGETFLLGASTWRIEEITHDRVLVSPAPGEPGKMPFWKGEAAGRTVELGKLVGGLTRELRGLPRSAARATLTGRHGLDGRAADNLLAYLRDQADATEVVPDDRHIVIEQVRDELGDWRVCVLTPLGGRVHAPWAMAVTAKARAELGLEVESMWTDEGFVVRFPETEAPPDVALLVPQADELEALVLRQLGSSALFAAKFREAAARALLLPRRFPGRRAPLWQTRKKAADLLAVAAGQPSFPILLEAYRECLRDVFDLPALTEILAGITRGEIAVKVVATKIPSPFAQGLLFGYVANYIYDGDAPLAERRAQALTVDESLLRELLGEAELRELLDPDTITAVEEDLQQLAERLRARSADGVHDLLLRLGDLTRPEIERRSQSPAVAQTIDELIIARRAVELTVAGQRRFVAAEHASRYRDALGAALPPGLPEAFRRSPVDPLGDLLLRFARTHGPFPASAPASRLGLPADSVQGVLHRLAGAGKLVEGAFRRGETDREWCDPEILRSVRRRSLARLRKEVEPVEPAVLARFVTRWQGVLPDERRRGLDATLDAVEKLQGVPLPASMLEHEILPARVEGYLPGDLDALAAAGEIVWIGVSPLGSHDGRVALYLTDGFPLLHLPVDPERLTLDPKERAVLAFLQQNGASFFAAIHAGIGGGFPQGTATAVWSLVWKGLCTNDTFRALRAFVRERGGSKTARRRGGADRGFAMGALERAGNSGAGLLGTGFRSRRQAPPSAEGRWSLVAAPRRAGSDGVAGGARTTGDHAHDTERAAALAQQLLTRYGLVTREVGAAEEIPGGFSAVYEVLRTMEETGKIRRGYFVAGVAAMQFALPPVLDMLRGLRTAAELPEVVVLPAVDPANPYGALLPWPGSASSTGPGDVADSDEAKSDNDTRPRRRGPTRNVGAHVVLVDGALAAFVARGGRQMTTFLPVDDPERARVAGAVATAVARLAGGRGRRDLLLVEIDDRPAAQHVLADTLVAAGFISTYGGLQYRPPRPPRTPADDLAEGA